MNLPTLFMVSPKAEERFWEFFASDIRNVHTRRAYYNAVCRFSDWCASRRIGLIQVRPLHVAAYIEQMMATHSKASVKLVREDGSMTGTIGGGCVEAELWNAAREVIETERPKHLTFNLGQDAAYDNGLICGGQLDVFVEPVLPVPHAYIFGADHISKSLSKVATLAGFATVVVDNRDTFANRERFPKLALRCMW